MNMQPLFEDQPLPKISNDAKEWCLDGKLHKESGPAIERFNGDKLWYINDKLHREDGPAIEKISGSKYWYLNGNKIEYDPETWDQDVKESHMEHIMGR